VNWTPSRRAFLATSAGTAVLASLPAGRAVAAPAGGDAFGRDPFGLDSVGLDARPGFRWWWPDGLVDPDEIRREIDQIADAGFGRVEIAGVHHSISDPSVLDTAHHGWGSGPWVAGVEAALRQAARRGVTVDLTLGPAWPPSVPSITPDSPGAAKELVYGVTTVAAGATFTGPPPAPLSPAASGVTQQTLLAVQAFRLDPANNARKITGLDQASLTDLTSKVSGGSLTWTAPSDGPYLLFAHWVRGSGQQPERGPHTSPTAYVVDHFGAAGAQAIIDFWDSAILTPRLRALLRAAGGAIFEDSIELESAGILWTPGLPAEFARRAGYDLIAHLPAVLQIKGNLQYAFAADVTAQVRRDLSAVLTQLINENHFLRIRSWAHGLGLGLRAQPYGLATDAMSSATLLDIPEGESIGFKNLDDFRCMAGARDMAGRRLLSEELGAYLGGAYNTTWNRLLTTVGGQFAAGVNNLMLHGFAYATAPGVAWPGFAAFSPYDGTIGYSEAWGPRQPSWLHAPDISGYIGRVQRVLRTGRPAVDVAYFWQSGFVGTGLGAQWFTATGVPLGWTHEMVSPPLFTLPAARVSGGRLNPDGPAYKVLVIDGDILYGREHTMPVATARKILDLARSGLRVVFVGTWNDAHVPGIPKTGENATLQALVDQLLGMPNVAVAPTTADIPAALNTLGVTPDVSYSQSSTLLNAHRVDGDVDYYYFCNGKHAETVKPPVAPIDHQVTLTRTDPHAVPFSLDPWTGRSEPIAEYTESGGTVTVRMTLRPGQAAIVVLSRPGHRGGAHRAVHATATEADLVRFGESRGGGVGGLVVRAAQAGTYATTLSDGSTARTTIASVPAAPQLTPWTLTVDDWQPGATATETVVVKHTLTLDSLAPWPSIPELQDVSGIGRYTTTFDVGPDWTPANGAYLDLGGVFDTFRVTVNGRRVPAAVEFDTRPDIGGFIRRGVNTLEIEVTTTLLNRLRVSNPSVFGGAARQAYGLLGPVRLIPYTESPV
jgi:hypothetical protein